MFFEVFDHPKVQGLNREPAQRVVPAGYYLIIFQELLIRNDFVEIFKQLHKLRAI